MFKVNTKLQKCDDFFKIILMVIKIICLRWSHHFEEMLKICRFRNALVRVAPIGS